MQLNEDKFDLLQFKSNPNNNSLKLLKNSPFSNQFLEYKLPNQSVLQPSNFVKDLGIFIDSQLDWGVQYTSTIYLKKLAKHQDGY